MSTTAAIALISLAAHFALPAINALAPGLSLPSYSVDISDELDAYRSFATRRNKLGMMAIQTAIVRKTPQLPIRAVIWLPSVWAAKTPWQLEISIAHVKAALK